ncbi:Filament-like plant protein 7 [Bienertia sinuspersici]
MTVDFEKEKKKLEGKLAKANKRVGNLSVENGNLMKALLCKEKLVQDLNKEKVELEAELSMLMSRLDSAEKESTFLKSELENAKQIKKLEAECHQLWNLIRKRLQDPTVPLNTKRSSSRMGNCLEKSGKGSVFPIEKI